MKVIETSPTRLVAKENILINYIAGGVCVLGGLGALAVGMADSKAVLAFGIIFIVAGLGTILISRSEELTADTGTGQITVESRGVFGKKAASYAISNVSAVRLLTDYRVGIKYSSGQTELVLKGGETVVIEHSSGSQPGAGGSIGGRLAKLIGVPYSENAPAKPQPMPDALEKAAPAPAVSRATSQPIMPATPPTGSPLPTPPTNSAGPSQNDGPTKDKPLS